MGFSYPAIGSIVLSMFLAVFWMGGAVIGTAELEASDLALKQELEHLKEKIAALETDISERNHELHNKDELIAHLEKVILQKSTTISTLKSEIESLQKKGSLEAEELVREAHDRVDELEKQVDNLRDELELQSRKKEALNDQASKAEKNLQELNLKLEDLEKENAEQKCRIRETERALRVAEEELMRAHIEATTKSKELIKVHGDWLPPWLATHMSYYQDIVAKHWKEHAQPTLDVVLQKASEKSAQAHEWFEPHLGSLKTKWIPGIRDRWEILATTAQPYVQNVVSIAEDVYKASKNTIAPHIAKVQEAAEPYFQEAHKLSKPYVDQVAAATKPHLKRVKVALDPYTERVVDAYKKLLKSTTRHHQI